jgi:hypothetical protein
MFSMIDPSEAPQAHVRILASLLERTIMSTNVRSILNLRERVECEEASSQPRRRFSTPDLREANESRQIFLIWYSSGCFDERCRQRTTHRSCLMLLLDATNHDTGSVSFLVQGKEEGVCKGSRIRVREVFIYPGCGSPAILRSFS